mgnify:FL=1
MSESVNSLKTKVAELLQQNSDIVKVLQRQHEINFEIVEEVERVKRRVMGLENPDHSCKCGTVPRETQEEVVRIYEIEKAEL